MLLNSIDISRKNKWRTDVKVEYEGEIEYEGEHGTIKINLNDETSRKVIAVVAAQLVESSKDIAERLTADMLESIPAQLEDKSEKELLI